MRRDGGSSSKNIYLFRRPGRKEQKQRQGDRETSAQGTEKTRRAARREVVEGAGAQEEEARITTLSARIKIRQERTMASVMGAKSYGESSGVASIGAFASTCS